jgi:tetratricopeptide (TPR) repeat protein
MRLRLHFLLIFSSLLVSAAWQPVAAQYGFDLEIKKPEPYDNRVLRAEKTPDKKIKAPKRFFQNLYTHYNYYFNANTKLNEVLERAKSAHKDDYSALLPFYNYSFDITSQDQQLDTVISKSKTGIVMHDLRNDWIDNLYMLWGASYFFQKKFDSASLMFQFINTAFAEKENDGYYRYIGSRMDGGNANSIATKESNSFVKKVFSTSPSRNDAFVWQVRSMIEMDRMSEAATLIAMLKEDPHFPGRLNDDLEEVQAYWFYKNNMWDSSATHLVKALDQAQSKAEKARWEYLAAQMFDRSKKTDEALNWYKKALAHSTDPVMDVYARLNLVRLDKDGGENYIEKNIAELVKMGKREKFAEYRDVIFYMAAQMELERGNLAGAEQLLLMASKNKSENPSARNNAFLQIADLSYQQKKYVQSAYFYDSVQTGLLKPEEVERVNSRKPALGRAATALNILSRQDSLLRIAAMPEEERKEYITKLAKKLRKQQGLADEGAAVSGGRSSSPGSNNQPTDLFQSQNKGDWYFYNNDLKTKGAEQFKQTWGNRPNTDNWRRFSDVSKQLVNRGNNNNSQNNNNQLAATDKEEDNSPSYASLVKKLPLTPETMQRTNDSIKTALFTLGKVYLKEIEDYPSVIEVYEKLRSQFPEFNPMDEVLFGLYYAYTKTGDAVKAALIKSLLTQKYPSSNFTAIATTGKDPSKNTEQKTAATKDYEAVYDLFIEGRFDEAKAAKKIADSVHRTNYWQPQLLYIEAVYYVKNREDSLAKNILNTLIAQGAGTPLAQKAKTMIDVLNRRTQIEDELNRLQIERPMDSTLKETSIAAVQKPVMDKPATPAPKEVTAPQVREEEAARPTGERQGQLGIQGRNKGVNTSITAPNLDSSGKKLNIKKPGTASVYSFDVASAHYGVVILNKVDAVFGSESKNAFARFSRERFYAINPPVNITELDSVNKLLLVGPFNNAQDALDFILQAKKMAPNEIIPWLKPDRYSFFIISTANLELLQSDKSLDKYRKFLEQHLPGKF